MFGLSMLVSQLIPGLVLGVVLAANGCVLLYELRILISLDRQEGSVDVAAGRLCGDVDAPSQRRA
jgi:hypothetical protein